MRQIPIESQDSRRRKTGDRRRWKRRFVLRLHCEKKVEPYYGCCADSFSLRIHGYHCQELVDDDSCVAICWIDRVIVTLTDTANCRNCCHIIFPLQLLSFGFEHTTVENLSHFCCTKSTFL